MNCNGSCYCGNLCNVDHEVDAKRCDCNGYHLICRKICSSCNGHVCAYIANHKTNYGGCLCITCVMSEHQNSFKKYQIGKN